ncbi:Uncharacterised protein [Vibrio cholerae]|nr:Uncharacterised protein [Vibrio cholerae]
MDGNRGLSDPPNESLAWPPGNALLAALTHPLCTVWCAAANRKLR